MEDVANKVLDVANKVLGDADLNDCVRFAILSSNFDRAFNTMYQPRSQVTVVALAELCWKTTMLDTSSTDFPFTTKMYWTEVKIFLTLLISRMTSWTLPSTPNVSHSFPRTSD